MSIKKRLYIHIGPLKTGTSSLQTYFYTNRKLNLEHNLLYPLAGLDVNMHSKAKHQEYINALLSGDIYTIDSLFKQLEEESLASTASRVLISSEGFYNHLWEFSEIFVPILKRLSERFDIVVLFIVRELSSYFESYYKQCLSNPPIFDDLGYGRPLTPREFFILPRIQQNLRFHEILMFYSAIVGKRNIHLFSYESSDIVAQMLSYFDLPMQPINHVNRSISNLFIPILKEYNRGKYPEIKRGEFIRLLKASETGAMSKLHLTLLEFDLITDIKRLEERLAPIMEHDFVWPEV